MAVGSCQCSVPFFTLQSGNRQDASDDPSPSTLACVYRCLWTSTSSTCFPTPIVVRHDICWQNCTVERRLVISFCGQSYYCNSPSIWQLAFKLTCHTHTCTVVNICLTVSGQVNACVVQTCTNVVLSNHWHATVAGSTPWTILSTSVHCPIMKYECALQLLHKDEDDAVKWLQSMAITALAKWNYMNIQSPK